MDVDSTQNVFVPFMNDEILRFQILNKDFFLYFVTKSANTKIVFWLKFRIHVFRRTKTQRSHFRYTYKMRFLVLFKAYRSSYNIRHIFNIKNLSLSTHLLLMNVMLDFICMGFVKLVNEK